MAISTIGSAGLTSPLPAANLGTPSAINLSNATALPSAALPTGCVLQVVNAVYNTVTSTNNTTYTSTTHSASITPKFATSKILVMVTATGGTNTTAQPAYYTVFRNGSVNLSTGTSICTSSDMYSTGGAMYSQIAMNFFDNPATTSSTSYTVYFASNNSSATAQYTVSPGTPSSGQSQIILMEIAA